ncbi:MAG: DNRLRE domain-containing protein [Syntrophomonadaceae bacterium]
MPSTELGPIKCVYIAQYYSDRNFIQEPSLFVSRYKNTGDVYRSLLQFPLSRGLYGPVSASTPERVRLKLDIIHNDIPRGNILVSVHNVWQAWLENTVSWLTQPLFSISPEISCPVRAGFTGSLEFDLTDLARSWQQGTLSNYGLLLSGDEEHNRLLSLAGRNPPSGRKPPRLELEYKRKALNKSLRP